MKKTVSIEIDSGSGFCFGVVNAIKKAENELKEGNVLYCLGDIVHNSMEMKRLEGLGLKSIERDDFKNLKDETVLLRAHGEPPSTYKKAEANNTALIDATCPVVLRLQKSVKSAYQKSKKDSGQVVIFGQIGHAEVNGLVGQTENSAIVIESVKDIYKVDLSLPIRLFSQTTKMVDEFLQIKSKFEELVGDAGVFEVYNTICRQVSGRIDALQKFSKRNDVIVFVSGKKSSNGKALFKECIEANPSSYMVENESEVESRWFLDASRIGICGATSTPDWLMEHVAESIRKQLIP
jgi:4-hydroxy-3-methylbut-2-enyl diphosphate reductase